MYFVLFYHVRFSLFRAQFSLRTETIFDKLANTNAEIVNKALSKAGVVSLQTFAKKNVFVKSLFT